MSIEPVHANAEAIAKAAVILHQGGLVAFPTETVYGLGADAENPDAVRKIFTAKGRPADHPLIVHIGSSEMLDDWAQHIPDAAYQLAARFWPGPLTLIMHKPPKVPLIVTGGQPTIALRIPDNPVALNLLRAFGGGIAAPSANRYNRISPTQAQHVVSELGDAVDMILDGGPCAIGLESTIVDLTGEQPVILRPGHINRLQIEESLQRTVSVAQRAQIRAPGMLEIHYAPLTPALLCSSRELQGKVSQLAGQNKRIGLLSYTGQIQNNSQVHSIQMPRSAPDYGKMLYAALHELDELQLDAILVEKLPDTEEWRAINDRLSKATISL